MLQQISFNLFVMKKSFFALSAIALAAFAFTSCNGDKKTDLDINGIVLDGFYVYGDATGEPDKVLSQNAMAAGFNEVDKAVRTGMYEKYIWLEADKEFALIENSAGSKKYYGADLKEVNYGYDEADPDCKNFDNNPNMKILQGTLVIGDNAPKMKVSETGMYHIVLDNNTLGDLENPQIIIQRAKWGVRGGMNGWGFTEATETVGENGTVVYTLKDQELAANGEFKFASCHGWKINLDENGLVKAEISLGLEDGKLALTSTNISVKDAGLYDITLTYSPKAGALAESFTYEAVLTKVSDLPTEVYMIGAAFGNWNWADEGVVSLIPAHSEAGNFWAVRYIEANSPFKFCTVKEWNGDFTNLGTDSGYTVDGGNCLVAESGLYMIEIDLKNNAINIHKAEIFGIGDVFGNWTEGANPYTINEDGTASIVAAAAGAPRTYVGSVSESAAGNWWHRELGLVDGKIVYRAAGNEVHETFDTVAAGQTITLNFNAGTGSIK